MISLLDIEIMFSSERDTSFERSECPAVVIVFEVSTAGVICPWEIFELSSWAPAPPNSFDWDEYGLTCVTTLW